MIAVEKPRRQKLPRMGGARVNPDIGHWSLSTCLDKPSSTWTKTVLDQDRMQYTQYSLQKTTKFCQVLKSMWGAGRMPYRDSSGHLAIDNAMDGWLPHTSLFHQNLWSLLPLVMSTLAPWGLNQPYLRIRRSRRLGIKGGSPCLGGGKTRFWRLVCCEITTGRRLLRTLQKRPPFHSPPVHAVSPAPLAALMGLLIRQLTASDIGPSFAAETSPTS